MPAPLASWNPARDAWETSHSHIDLFSGLSAVWSETWPSWGMWADGVAYARPTSAPLTDGSGSSSPPGLLPTPTTQDGANLGGPSQFERNSLPLNAVAALLPTPAAGNFNDGESVESWESRRLRNKAKGINGNGQGTPLGMAVQLLPTPKATDGTKGGPNQRGSSGDLTLPSAAMTLLPTPTATPYGNNQSPSPGAAVRPSLDTLAPMLLPTPTRADGDRTTSHYERGNPTLIGALLPTPTAMDSRSSSGSNPDWGHGLTLTDAARSIGAPTSPPSDDGNAP